MWGMTKHIVLCLTLSFSLSCQNSLNDKLDANLQELRALNGTFKQLNETTERELGETNENFGKLVTAMNPDRWIDQISLQFEETINELTGGEGNLRMLLENGNRVTTELLSFLDNSSFEDLMSLSDTVRTATDSLVSLNQIFAEHADSIPFLAEQMVMTSQVMLLLASGTGMISLDDAEELVALYNSPPEGGDLEETSRQILDVHAGSAPMGERLIFLTEEKLREGRENSDFRAIATFAREFTSAAQSAGGIRELFRKDVVGATLCGLLKIFADLVVFEASNVEGMQIDIATNMMGGSGTASIRGRDKKITLAVRRQEAEKIRKGFKEYCSDYDFNFNWIDERDGSEG